MKLKTNIRDNLVKQNQSRNLTNVTSIEQFNSLTHLKFIIGNSLEKLTTVITPKKIKKRPRTAVVKTYILEKQKNEKSDFMAENTTAKNESFTAEDPKI